MFFVDGGGDAFELIAEDGIVIDHVIILNLFGFLYNECVNGKGL